MTSDRPTTKRLPARVLSAIFSQPWAIVPEYLDTIISIARLEGDPDFTPPAVQDEDAPGTEVTRLDGGGTTAVIPIVGPIFPHANSLTRMSGATSLAMIDQALDDAVRDPGVDSIILHFDSPGGAATGIAEFSETIRAATKQKPVVSYVYGYAGSAAYWLAAATSRIVMHRSALVGSIGVIGTVTRQEEPDRDGKMAYEIVSSNAPNKRPDPTTETGRAEILRRLNALESIFVADIAAYRGVSTETVLKDFGRGAMLSGDEALANNMVDSIGGFGETVAALRPQVSGFNANEPSRGVQMAGENNAPAPEPVTMATLRNDHPDLVGQISDEARAAGVAVGRAEGQTAERERQTAIDQLVEAGDDSSFVAELRASEKSVGDVALALAKHRREGRAAALTARTEGAPEPVPTPPAPNDNAGASDLAGLHGEDRYKREWETSAKIREEFGGKPEHFARYAAYRAAEDRRLTRASA